MQHDEFIGQVQARARLSSRGDAERATRATLETLAERLAGGLKDKLAAQLPPELGRHLKQQPAASDPFGLDEFFQRVAKREGIDLPQATFHTRAVIEVVGEAVTQGQLAKVRDQLPAEFDPLFSSGSSGQLRS
jgi:uncharacterized protein (DUF2267 family)